MKLRHLSCRFSYKIREYRSYPGARLTFIPILIFNGTEYEVSEDYPTRTRAMNDARKRFKIMRDAVELMVQSSSHGTEGRKDI